MLSKVFISYFVMSFIFYSIFNLNFFHRYFQASQSNLDIAFAFHSKENKNQFRAYGEVQQAQEHQSLGASRVDFLVMGNDYASVPELQREAFYIAYLMDPSLASSLNSFH